MKKEILSSALAFTSIFTMAFSQSFACDIDGKTGFMPKNDLYISVEDKDTNGMTEQKFLSIINRVYNVYAPIVKEKGGVLQMNNKWDDGTVNASANRSGKNWYVNMYGGLARHSLTTDDAFMLVVCHETGHHLGGFPRISGIFGSKWAANEGQADYFGALKCMKRVLSNDDNRMIVSKMNVDAEATKQCQMIYKNDNEIALCQRIAMAGKSLGSLLGSLGGSSNVNFNTPDTSVVKKTNDAHPAAQCRLDTYFAGSLCDKAFTDDVSQTSAIPGTCVKKDGYNVGTRPLCWYKPSSSEI